MKRSTSLLLVLLLVVSCGKYKLPHSMDMLSSGCISDTRAGEDDFPALDPEDTAPELFLEYTPEGLAVTRKNAKLNCSIKNSGISCEATLSGNVLTYRAYETNGLQTNCLCLVQWMTSTVPGLQEDTEYTLEYTCGHEYLPIQFRYRKGMSLRFDLKMYEKY
ncbi:MAG: hypothetical protein IJG35_07630 [Bacteroidales bacterium]|nr:hypothetical protein [Bacteroidales bacterium]MBQ3439833.1 hypothetical protein [Bacteroidales bacterium]MBR1794887.1 hypothetical protein [Bacteroidales bacterium]